MRKLFLLVGTVALFVVGAQAQNPSSKRTAVITSTETLINENSTETTIPRKCGTMEYMAEQKLLDPTLETRMQQLEEYTQEWIKDNPNYSPKAVITVPVVVHIVYSNTAYNVSDARVQEQINILNTDYAGLNTHSMGAFSTSLKSNTELQFCLAKRDPNGNATTGIERRGTSGVDASFSTDNQVKHYSQGGLDQWNPNKYMNIWVCNLGSSLCGYAEFPTGTGSISSTNFGVVIHYQFFGQTGATSPYNLGGTTTHEIGHCFNLYHIWGDDGTACTGTDYVTDTPNQAGDRSTCPAVGATVTDACTTTSPGIMYMNFMDYSFDACYANFTPGQKARIQACFTSSGPLYQLGNSDGCTPVGGTTAPVANFSANATNVSVGTTVTFTDLSTNTPTSWSWALTPATGFAYANSTTSTSQNPQITFNTAGTYTVALTATNSAGNNTNTKTSYITVTTGGTTGTCDTIGAPSFAQTCGSSLTYYKYSGGYVSGNNGYGDAEKAQKFLSAGANKTVSKVLVYAVKKNGTTGNTYVKLYSVNPTTKAPATLLGTSNPVTLSGINASGLTEYSFASPITIPTDFVASVVLPTGATDTLVVVSTANNCYSNDSLSWEKWSDGTWQSIEHAWTSGGVGLKIDLAIFPIICDVVTEVNDQNILENINLFPNPSKDIFTIDFGGAKRNDIVISVYNTVGDLIQTINKSNASILTIDLSTEKSGIYFVNIKTGEGSITKRISLIK